MRQRQLQERVCLAGRCISCTLHDLPLGGVTAACAHRGVLQKPAHEICPDCPSTPLHDAGRGLEQLAGIAVAVGGPQVICANQDHGNARHPALRRVRQRQLSMQQPPPQVPDLVACAVGQCSCMHARALGCCMGYMLCVVW